MLRLPHPIGGGGVSFPGKKRYKGVRFNDIGVTRGWVGVKFLGKKNYITLEWPLIYRYQCLAVVFDNK